MPIEPMILASGQLSASQSVLYTVPDDEVAYVKLIALSNLHTSAVVAELYARKLEGTARRIYYKSLSQDETERLSEPLSLGPGDTLLGEASIASVVDYLIAGAADTTNLSVSHLFDSGFGSVGTLLSYTLVDSGISST